MENILKIRETIKELLVNKLIKNNNIDERVLDLLWVMAKDNVDILNKFLEILKNRKDVEIEKVNIKFDENFIIINYMDIELKITPKNLQIICFNYLTILENNLPVGSVVTIDSKGLEYIITKRYIFNDVSKAYCPYELKPYPFASFNNNTSLFITNKEIIKVVFKGYTDQSEDNYQYTMLKKFLIDGDYLPMNFASKEEIGKLLELNYEGEV